ncbi:MAG: peroxide stress protein YaaA [Frankia sp.]
MGVRILLPPSEAKATGGDGPALRAAGFGDGPLAPVRQAVLTAVAELCRDDPAAAAAALKLPPGRAEEDLARNVAVLEAPTLAALDRFTGVVYAALDPATLPLGARAVADRSVMIVSGGFGLLGATDAVPDHRVGMAVTVPGLGPLTPLWRGHLRALMPTVFAGGQLVVDLRSSDYAAVLTATGPLRRAVVVVRVLTERRVGRKWVRRVVSYSSKQVKGQVARELILAEAAGTPIEAVEDVEKVAVNAGFTVERRSTPGAGTALDVVLRETGRR